MEKYTHIMCFLEIYLSRLFHTHTILKILFPWVEILKGEDPYFYRENCTTNVFQITSIKKILKIAHRQNHIFSTAIVRFFLEKYMLFPVDVSLYEK